MYSTVPQHSVPGSWLPATTTLPSSIASTTCSPGASAQRGASATATLCWRTNRGRGWWKPCRVQPLLAWRSGEATAPQSPPRVTCLCGGRRRWVRVGVGFARSSALSLTTLDAGQLGLDAGGDINFVDQFGREHLIDADERDVPFVPVPTPLRWSGMSRVRCVCAQ